MEASAQREARNRDQDAKERLASLIVYTVALIVVCLTAFNFYLLLWIWSALRDGRQLDLLSAWDEFGVEGKLVSRNQFQVGRIKSRRDTLKICPSNAQFMGESKKSIKFQLAPNNASAEEPANLLELSSDDRCSFESGFQVRGLHSARVALVCGQPTAATHNQRQRSSRRCLVDKSQVVRLANTRGVDFLGKSVQTNQVTTRQLHSALNELHLMSPDESLFGSSNGTIGVRSMEDVILASKRANVSPDLLECEFR